MKSKLYKNVLAYRYSNYRYEIQLKIQVRGRGNFHSPLLLTSIVPYRIKDYDWIYTDTIDKRLDAKSIIFTHEQREIMYPWSQDEIKGYIDFKSDSIIINLLFPHYEGDTLDHWEPYEFNGIYKLVVKQDTLPLIEKID
jgi:hypothetical protein